MDEDAELAVETKVYALFFLNVAVVELDPRANFDFLLEGHSEDLPLEIRLALRHENEGKKSRMTTLAKRQDRHLQRMLKANKPLRDHIKAMYEVPVKDVVAREKRALKKGGGS